MTKKEKTVEVEGRIRQFLRILISYNDLRHAEKLASYILENKVYERTGSRLLHEALNCAMIVAYARPFSGNDKKTRPRVPDLSDSFLKVLTEAEREIHQVAIADRNTVLAHSDSNAWDIQPTVLALKDHKVLLPMGADTRSPLTREATETLKSAAHKLMEAVFKKRNELEPGLLEYFDEVDITELEKRAAESESNERGV